jgi:hypothetical protein
MVEKDSGSGSSTADTERDLERERTKNVHYSSVGDSSELLVESDEFGETSAGEGGMNIRFDDHTHDEDEASVDFSCDGNETDEDNQDEEEEEDWFAERHRHLEDDNIDAALEKELDEQMEALWDDYSNDIHVEIQNELDQALQQQLDEQLNETYNRSRVELQLEEDWDLQAEDEFEHIRYEREDLEPSSTRQFTRCYPVESKPSSVESINALIQQVVEKHRPTLER